MRLLPLLLVGCLLASGVAHAHPWGRAGFDRAVSGDEAFLVGFVANVTKADAPVAVHVEIRDPDSDALLNVSGLRGSVHPVGDAAADRPVRFQREGAGRFMAHERFASPGPWVLEVENPASGGAAAFPFTVYPANPFWVDYVPMALERPVAGVPATVRMAVVDGATGGLVQPTPEDAVLVVERWDEWHERRLGVDRVPLDGVDPGFVGRAHVFAEAGAYDLRVEIPSLGLVGAHQPALDVHVAEPAPVEVAGAPPEPASGGVPLAGFGVLVAFLCGTALLLLSRRRG